MLGRDDQYRQVRRRDEELYDIFGCYTVRHELLAEGVRGAVDDVREQGRHAGQGAGERGPEREGEADDGLKTST